jgi:hypothetical protein
MVTEVDHIKALRFPAYSVFWQLKPLYFLRVHDDCFQKPIRGRGEKLPGSKRSFKMLAPAV